MSTRHSPNHTEKSAATEALSVPARDTVEVAVTVTSPQSSAEGDSSTKPISLAHDTVTENAMEVEAEHPGTIPADVQDGSMADGPTEGSQEGTAAESTVGQVSPFPRDVAVDVRNVIFVWKAVYWY